MENNCYYGVGCFHFSLKQLPPSSFKVSRYIDELRSALQSIPSISNIVIDYDETEDEDISLDVNEKPPTLSTDHGAFPCIDFLEISFTIYIPYRVQVELLGLASIARETIKGDSDKEFASLTETFTETFNISIYQTFWLPVAFIDPVNPCEPGSSPSTAVQIIREFLKQEFKKVDSPCINFDFLGPSPFHADFYVFEKHDESNNAEQRPADIFACDYWPMPGYDKIVFRYDPKHYSLDEAKAYAKYKILDELGFFYNVIQERVLTRRSWDEVNDIIIDRLISMQRSEGVRGFSERLLKGPRLISEALILIAEFESEYLRSDSVRRREYIDLYQKSPESCVKHLIDKEIQNQYIYPTEQMRALINQFESRRANITEVLFVLLSAILGGVIGSLITIFLSR